MTNLLHATSIDTTIYSLRLDIELMFKSDVYQILGSWIIFQLIMEMKVEFTASATYTRAGPVPRLQHSLVITDIVGCELILERKKTLQLGTHFVF
jgi:hypothetical protein